MVVSQKNRTSGSLIIGILEPREMTSLGSAIRKTALPVAHCNRCILDRSKPVLATVCNRRRHRHRTHPCKRLVLTCRIDRYDHPPRIQRTCDLPRTMWKRRRFARASTLNVNLVDPLAIGGRNRAALEEAPQHIARPNECLEGMAGWKPAATKGDYPCKCDSTNQRYLSTLRLMPVNRSAVPLSPSSSEVSMSLRTSLP